MPLNFGSSLANALHFEGLKRIAVRIWSNAIFCRSETLKGQGCVLTCMDTNTYLWKYLVLQVVILAALAYLRRAAYLGVARFDTLYTMV